MVKGYSQEDENEEQNENSYPSSGRCEQEPTRIGSTIGYGMLNVIGHVQFQALASMSIVSRPVLHEMTYLIHRPEKRRRAEHADQPHPAQHL